MAVQYPHLNPNHGGAEVGMVSRQCSPPPVKFCHWDPEGLQAPLPWLALTLPAPPSTYSWIPPQEPLPSQLQP